MSDNEGWGNWKSLKVLFSCNWFTRMVGLVLKGFYKADLIKVAIAFLSKKLQLIDLMDGPWLT